MSTSHQNALGRYPTMPTSHQNALGRYLTMSTSHENALGRYLLTWTTDNRRPDGRRVAEGRDPAASPRKSWAPGAASTRRAPDCRAAPAAGTAGSDSHVLFHKDKISIRRRLWSGSPGRLSLSLSLSLFQFVFVFVETQKPIEKRRRAPHR